MSRRHNPERAKLHLSYSIDEICTLFDVTKSTLTNWITQGLTPIDRKRPLLFAGPVLRAFIKGRMDATRRPCQPSEIFCVACKATKVPAGKVVDFEEVSATAGNIIGECPHCHRRIYRRVAIDRLVADCGDLAVSFKKRHPTLNEETNLSSYAAFRV